jgi:hypothetical protein
MDDMAAYVLVGDYLRASTLESEHSARRASRRHRDLACMG